MKWVCALFVMLVMVNKNMQCEKGFAANLDTYLRQQKVLITEGYLTPRQKSEFIRDMQRVPNIKKILEIGFNAGHSAELFLTTTDCEKLVSFDINIHPYLKFGAEYISKKFGDRFTLIEGDSKRTIPEYTEANNNEKFDLIFIDGDHSFDGCLADIQNCSQLAHPQTLLLIDDYVAEVKAAVDACVNSGLIVLLDCKHVKSPYIPNRNSGERIYVVAQYLKSSH